MATRQGLALRKSRRRDPRAVDYGTYWIIDPYRSVLVWGNTNTGYGLTLDDVEAWLTKADDEAEG